MHETRNIYPNMRFVWDGTSASLPSSKTKRECPGWRLRKDCRTAYFASHSSCSHPLSLFNRLGTRGVRDEAIGT